jgi:hypothetical protein
MSWRGRVWEPCGVEAKRQRGRARAHCLPTCNPSTTRLTARQPPTADPAHDLVLVGHAGGGGPGRHAAQPPVVLLRDVLHARVQAVRPRKMHSARTRAIHTSDPHVGVAGSYAASVRRGGSR